VTCAIFTGKQHGDEQNYMAELYFNHQEVLHAPLQKHGFSYTLARARQ